MADEISTINESDWNARYGGGSAQSDIPVINESEWNYRYGGGIPLSATDYIQGGLKGVAKSALDVFTAPADLLYHGGTSLLNALGDTTDYKGGYPSDRVNQALDYISGGQGDPTTEKAVRLIGDAGTALAVPSQAANLASALPFSASMPLLSKALGYGAEAAGYSVLGDAKADNPFQNMAPAAGLGIALPGALGAVGTGLEELGTRFKIGSLGIRGSDAKQALQRLPRTAAGAATENPLLTAISDIENQGGFKNGYSPQDVLETIRGQVADKGDQVTDIISAADKSGTTTLPTFDSTENFISGLKGSAQKDANEIYQKEVGSLIDTLDQGGTLTDWQKAKQSLQQQLGSSYSKANPSLKTEVQQKIASDIRQHIEDQTSALIPSAAGDVNQLNKEIGQRLSLDKILTRTRAADDASNPVKSIIGAMRTSGGFGVPMYLEYQDSHSVPKALAAGLGGAVLASRGGQYKTGQLLKTLGGLANAVPAGLATEAAPFALSALNAQDQTQPTSPPPSQLQSQSSKSLVKSITTPTPKKENFIDTAMNKAEAKLEGKPTQAPVVIEAKRVQPDDVPAIKTVMDSLFTQESGGKADAVSSKGAKGVGQLLDSTGKELFSKYKDVLPAGSNKKYDPFDSTQNKALSTLYVRDLLDKYDGDLELALTAYNQGMGRVDNLLKIHDADSLDEIRPYLGSNGRAYAKSIIGRLKKQGVIKV